MSEQPAQLDVVALLADLPEHGLVKGQVGAVVMELAGGYLEVEFVDEDGATYAQVPVSGGQLMRLHYHRVQAA